MSWGRNERHRDGAQAYHDQVRPRTVGMTPEQAHAFRRREAERARQAAKEAGIRDGVVEHAPEQISTSELHGIAIQRPDGRYERQGSTAEIDQTIGRKPRPPKREPTFFEALALAEREAEEAATKGLRDRIANLRNKEQT